MSQLTHAPTRKAIADKATRLHENNRVILLKPGRAVVIGDRDTYNLIKLGHRWTCNCPWAVYRSHWCECSHVVALRLALKDPRSQAAVARLADLTNAATDHTSESRGK